MVLFPARMNKTTLQKCLATNRSGQHGASFILKPISCRHEEMLEILDRVERLTTGKERCLESTKKGFGGFVI